MKKKVLYVAGAILILLIVTNPSMQSFKEFLGKNTYHGLSRKTNFFVFSSFSNEGINYIGVFGNFIHYVGEIEGKKIAAEERRKAYWNEQKRLRDSIKEANLPTLEVLNELLYPLPRPPKKEERPWEKAARLQQSQKNHDPFDLDLNDILNRARESGASAEQLQGIVERFNQKKRESFSPLNPDEYFKNQQDASYDPFKEFGGYKN